MMKKIFSLLAVFILIIIIPVSALAETDNKYALDKAGLIDSAKVAELETELKALSDKYSFDVVFLTVNTLDGKTPMEYADDYYDYNGYRNDGCLFLVSMEDRDWWISTKGFGITAITDYGINVIEGEVVPYLKSGDYSGACETYMRTVENFVVEAKNGTAYDTNNKYTNENGYQYSNSSSTDKSDVRLGAIAISLIVAVIIAAVIVGMVKKSYAPVRFKASAQDYLVDGSLVVTGEYDRFLYSNVSKTEIEHESSSGGGSSTHTSSSGSSHGGGGGKF